MPEEARISLGYYRGPVEPLLNGIDRAGLDGAVLEIDALDREELYPFVEERTANRPDLSEENRLVRDGKFRIGPFQWGPFELVLPIEGRNVAELVELIGRAAIHIWELNVRTEQRYLVQAPGVGDNEIWVSDHLSDESVAVLRSALAKGLQPEDS